MIREDIRTLKTGERDLRKFGLLVGCVFTILGILWWARGKSFFPYALVPGLALAFFGWLFPRLLKKVYIIWMTSAILLGFLVSTVLLTLFFMLAITPIGLLARLIGKDFLRLRLDPKAPTYWIARPPRVERVPSDYERQF
jgi:hypothetical protein